MQPRLTLIVAFAAALGSGAGCVGPPPEKLGRAQQGLDICVVSPEGALCDDNRPCTISDRCVGSVCVGTVAPNGTTCTDGDVCTLNDVCMAGLCMGTVAPDDNPCTDGDPCTQPDMCRAGRCQAGPPRICNDGNVCTTDLCIATVGCMAVPIPECVVPVDAGDAADAPPDQDTGADVVLPDLAPVDMPAPADVPVDVLPPVDLPRVDVPSIDVPAEMSLPEAGDTPSEVGPDMSPDELPEVSPMDVPDDSPAKDAPEDTPEPPADARDLPEEDAGIDGTEDDVGEAPPDLRARGGACVCSASDGPAAPGYLLVGLLVATAGWRRRRR